MTANERILVMRFGALGDIILCCQAFHDIRRAYPQAEIAFMTTKPFAALAEKMPWFNHVMVDDYPSRWQIGGWLKLIERIRDFNPTLIVDLQGKRRQSIMYFLLGGPFGTTWSGAAPFCAYPRLWPPEPNMHFVDFVGAQLRRAHIPPVEQPDFSWLDAPLDGFGLPERYALLVPGCSPGHDYKRWPASSYAAVARWLQERGITCFTVGTAADADAIAAVRVEAPAVVDLAGRTSLAQLAALARRATVVIGNDSGPIHLMDNIGAPTLALLSQSTDPAWSAPRNPRSAWRQGKPISTLPVDEVLLALEKMLAKNK